MLGEGQRRAPANQPACQTEPAEAAENTGSGCFAVIAVVTAFFGVAAGWNDTQARHAVADLAQVQPQAGGGGRAVEARFIERADEHLALLLVEPGFQIRRQGRLAAGNGLARWQARI